MSGTESALHAARVMRDCLAYPAIWLADDGSLHPALSRCKHRLCPLCSASRSRLVHVRVADVVGRWDATRHLVLTIRSTDATLTAQLDHLVASYRRLRQTTLWRRTVTAGIATIEVTRNASTGQWHPHLHVLITGDYVRHAPLRDAWEHATGGSTILHIEAVNSRDSASRYVAKYVAKPADLASWPPSAIVEYLDATANRRLLIATGAAHNARMTRVPSDDRPKLVRQVTHWYAIRRAYAASRPYGIALVDRVQSIWPTVIGHVLADCPSPPPAPPPSPTIASMTTLELLEACDHYHAYGVDPPSMMSVRPPVPRELTLWGEDRPDDANCYLV